MISYLLLILAALVTRLFSRLFLKLEIVGGENVPKTKGVLVIANHQTLIDSFFIGAFFLPLAYQALHPSVILWNAPEFKNFFRTKLQAWIFRKLRCEPVFRGTTSREVLEATFTRLRSILTRSNLLYFFEGTRSRNGEIGQAKSGIAKLITIAKPSWVLPVKIIGFDQILPVGSSFVRIGKKVKIIFGRPIKPNYLLLKSESTGRKGLGNLIRQLVMDLQ